VVCDVLLELKRKLYANSHEYRGAIQVRDGGYSQLQFFIVLPALLFSAQTSGQFFSMSPEISRATVAANSIFDLLDSKPSIITNQAKTTNDMSRLSESKTSVVGASVTLANASFTYPNQSSSTLDDINLTLPPNTFTAIVGPSGSGKSSLLALLQRFYDTTSGSIFLNDLRITELPVQAYRSRISLVPQEPTLFSGTIAFNVSLGAAPNTARPSHAQIEAVCKEVGIHDFIASLPQGYDTPCGDGGNQLSGGQKQRIALARALIRQPEILLLDECTASLDAQSEREVLDAVNRARKERNMMIVMVTHRLGAVVDADSIVVLENGRIAEKGVHGDLMTNEGLYWKMATEQGLV
jgi:ATP-binding cassette subfamily B (MDR/TAP) protein 1